MLLDDLFTFVRDTALDVNVNVIVDAWDEGKEGLEISPKRRPFHALDNLGHNFSTSCPRAEAMAGRSLSGRRTS